MKNKVKTSLAIVLFLSLGVLVGVLLCYLMNNVVFGHGDTVRASEVVGETAPTAALSQPIVSATPVPTDAVTPAGEGDGSTSGAESMFASIVPSKPEVKRCVYPKVTLTWDGVEGAIMYTVYRSKSRDGEYEEIATVDKNRFVDNTARRRRTYFYKVSAGCEIDGTEVFTEPGKQVKVYVQPDHPKTVIIGECFAVALERARSRFPSYYRFIAQGGMSTYSILNNNEFTCGGQKVTALEKAALYKPDRLVFLVGANGAGSVDPQDAGKNFEKMYKLMKRVNPAIQFVILAVSPWKSDSVYGRKMPSHEKRHQINQAYREVAEKYDNIYYCNLTERFEDSNGNLRGQFNTGDGLHWSVYARDYMTVQLQKWLKKKLGSV